MPENPDIENESLTDPMDKGTDKPAEENISAKEPETINPTPINDTMEVHKHPHNVMHKKNWPEYLLEFFMLFLAVFLGFVAENIRENSVERHRESDYIKSMVNDLKTDTTKLSHNILEFQEITERQDSLIKLYPLLDSGFNYAFFRNLSAIGGYPDFVYTDATIQQLKNSGGFRLIRNHKAIESIMAYDATVKKALINEEVLSRTLEKMVDFTTETFNAQGLEEQLKQGVSPQQLETENFDFLFTHDKIAMSKYHNRLVHYSRFCNIIKYQMEEVKTSAESLIGFLQKEYHLE